MSHKNQSQAERAVKKEYPDTIREFFQMFSDEQSCLNYLINLRWPTGFGRTRMRHIPDASGASLLPFLRDSILPGATLVTDAWNGYNQVVKDGYTREIKNLSDTDDFAHIHMPGVHRLASLLKRWILGMRQGSVSGMHLQVYLEEYMFRFNRRNARRRGLVFK